MPPCEPVLAISKQALRQLPHLLHIVPDRRQHLLVFVRAPILLQYHFHLAGDRCERGGQFMGCVGDKPALYGEGLLQAPEEFIKGKGQLAHFILPLPRLQAVREIIGRNIFYLPDYLGNRLQKLARKKIADQGRQQDTKPQTQVEYLIERAHPFQSVVVMTGHDDDKIPVSE